MKLKSHIPSVYPLSFAAIAIVLLLLEFNQATGSEFKILFFFLFAISSIAILIGAYSYWKRFQKNRLFAGHGVAFVLVMFALLIHVIDFFFGVELLSPGYSFGKRVIWLQCFAAFFISAPAVFDLLERKRIPVGSAGIWQPDIGILYLFCALYPAQHYIVNNLDAFSTGLMIQFALIALLLPALLYLLLNGYLRRFLTVEQFYLANLSVALVILLAYMRPVLDAFSILLSETVGRHFGVPLLGSFIFLVLAFAAYNLRARVRLFLTILLALAAVNFAYTLYATQTQKLQSDSETAAEGIVLSHKPNIYILFVDGYQSSEGLRQKGLHDLGIGKDLREKGFSIYEDAYSNYKPSVPSLTAFFEMRHHYYQLPSDWLPGVSGKNRLYSILKANGYRTEVAHPTDFFLRGKCESDFCFPAPGIFGQVSFTLAETIFFQKDFFKRTSVGMEKYQKSFYKILQESIDPFVIYSHVPLPSHGARGCIDKQLEIDRYGRELLKANQWILDTVKQIETEDPGGLIAVLGDHGAFLADDCTWDNPDVTSAHTILDNLGVLMAVRWPRDHESHYDAEIHTLMDLSWHMVQYLSNDEMDQATKPASASYLKSNGKIYKVIQDGIIIDNPQEYETATAQ